MMPNSDPIEGFDPARAQAMVGRGLLSAFGGVLLVGLAAAAIFQTGPEGTSWSTLVSQAHLPSVLAATVVMSGAFVFMGLRWRALMPAGHRPPFLGLTAMICAGLLLNYAVPGPFGELGAAWFAERRYKIPLADALASGVTARVIGLATAALLAMLTWLIADFPIPAGYERVVAIAAILSGAGGLALGWLAVRPNWWKQLSGWTLGRLADPGSAPGRLAGKLHTAVSTLADALAGVATRGRGAYLEAFGWSVAGHVLVMTGIAIAASSIGATIDLSGLAFTYATTTAGAVALFALPGSQVGWDAMFFTLLVATADLSSSDAIAVALIVRLQQLASMVFGAAMLLWLLRSKPTQASS